MERRGLGGGRGCVDGLDRQPGRRASGCVFGGGTAFLRFGLRARCRRETDDNVLNPDGLIEASAGIGLSGLAGFVIGVENGDMRHLCHVILGDAGDPAIRTRGTMWICRERAGVDVRLCLASGLGSIMMVGLLGFPGVELWLEAINVLWIASELIATATATDSCLAA